MPNAKSEIESQLYLDAMLYVLEDPALDRAGFEARLDWDFRLAEILTDSVELYELTQSVSCWEAGIPASLGASSGLDASSTRSPFSTVLPNSSSDGRRWSTTSLVLTASLLLSVVGWGVIVQRSSDALSQDDVVLAWGDMQSEMADHQIVREAVDDDSEWTIAMLDAAVEAEVPDWIVLATSDRLDVGLDSKDGKGVLQ